MVVRAARCAQFLAPCFMASEKKYEITVTARTAYIPEQSDPHSNRYVFAYTITIRNTGNVAAQLISRHWIITDSNNQVQEVRGLGVVGEQPLLKPGDAFEYTSATPLPTPSGIMVGTYEMATTSGERFEVAVPAFSLDSPHQAVQLN
jgi:ApaG protein